MVEVGVNPNELDLWIRVIEFIFRIIEEHGLALSLLIVYIWKDHQGKRGVIKKLNELEEYERNVFQKEISEVKILLSEVKGVLNTTTDTIKIISKK